MLTINYKWEYDEEGNIIEETEYLKSPYLDYFQEYTSINTYVYKDNNVLEIENKILNVRNINGMSDSYTYTFEYEFDYTGNWKKCITYKNNKPIFITTREYQYSH